MASYKKMGDKNWRVEISLGFDSKGKRLRVTKQNFRTKADAEKFAIEYQNNINKGYSIASSKNIVFKNFLMDWFNNHKIKNIGVNTRINYMSRIENYIIPQLGDYKLTEIDTPIMQDFYHFLVNDNNLKPTSAKKVIEIISSCFKYAKKLKLVTLIPTDIEKFKEEKPKVEFWNKKEVDFFLNEIKGTYLYTPVLIALLTGVRVGELCGIRWNSIDDNGYLTIDRQIIYDRDYKTLIPTNILKTDTSYRKISLPTVLLNYLKEFKEIDKDPLGLGYIIKSRDLYICNPRNLSVEFSKKVSEYPQLKKIPFHSLRHTHATLLIQNGENIKVVSDRLGHKDITTTLNTYTHVMEEMKENTAKLLDTMFLSTL